MRITTKGQVTIPIEIREQLGLLPNTDVEFTVRGKEVVLRPIKREPRRGHLVVEHLRGRGSVKLTTDQILALTRDR